MKVFIEYFNKVMDSLEIYQIVVIDINTNAKVKTGITSIYYFEVSKLLNIKISNY